MHVLVVGNPFDGLKLYGPFEDTLDAQEYAENSFGNFDWWIMELVPIEGIDGDGREPMDTQHEGVSEHDRRL